jgi:hypothetical protein
MLFIILHKNDHNKICILFEHKSQLDSTLQEAYVAE